MRQLDPVCLSDDVRAIFFSNQNSTKKLHITISLVHCVFKMSKRRHMCYTVSLGMHLSGWNSAKSTVQKYKPQIPAIPSKWK